MGWKVIILYTKFATLLTFVAAVTQMNITLRVLMMPIVLYVKLALPQLATYLFNPAFCFTMFCVYLLAFVLYMCGDNFNFRVTCVVTVLSWLLWLNPAGPHKRFKIYIIEYCNILCVPLFNNFTLYHKWILYTYLK